MNSRSHGGGSGRLDGLWKEGRIHREATVSVNHSSVKIATSRGEHGIFPAILNGGFIDLLK